jgi:hypothetical protein
MVPEKREATAAVFPEVCQDILQHGCELRFEASGLSMHPTIRHGERVSVVRVPPAVMKRGDVILYRGPAGIIAHRLVAIERRSGALTFITRGDAHERCDEPVDAACIYGQVVAVERHGRRIRLDTRLTRMGQSARVFTRGLRSRLSRLVSRSTSKHGR